MAFNWEDSYHQKTITAEQAAAMIKNGDQIMTGNREARAIVQKIIERTELRDVCYYAPIINWLTDLPNLGQGFRPATSFLNESSWNFYQTGRLDYIPGEYWQYDKIATVALKSKVALVEVTKPDENGYVSLGTCADFIRSACKKADLLIAETNQAFPFIYGDNVMHISEFDYIVEDGANYPSQPTPMDDDEESRSNYQAIGEYLSELILDEATLEVGLGRLNSSAMRYLDNVHDLGVHTEVYGDLMMELTERGIITNTKKSSQKGISVFTQMTGTQKLYEWADKNKELAICPCQDVLNPGVIYNQHRMTAINNAVEIDLLGQANAEYLKGRQYSGMGGICNFASAAAASPGGKSIVVLESITKNGKFSKITPFFQPGTPISLPRTAIEYVVTEQGVATLVGKTPSERTRELIRIAHPSFREELIFNAKKIGLL